MGFFSELKRRNVFRVGIAYALVAWVVLQVVDFLTELIGAPDWVLQVFFIAAAIGLLAAVIFSWVFEMTPEGIKLEKEVDRTASITPQTGRKLDRIIIVFLAVAVVFLLARPYWEETSAPEVTTPAGTQEVAPDAEDPLNASGAPQRSVAVLPFVAMSSGEEDGYFADGLTEEILNALAQLPELQVTARTSSFAFKGEDVAIEEIADTLGVRHVVEGSVRRSGDRLRVTAQLIRAEDGFHLWSDTYDSTSQDLITVQEDIAEQIAIALDVVLDESKREAMQLAGLRNVEAFTRYQEARYYYQIAHGEAEQIPNLREANRLIEEVLELVPGYAPAHVEHSDFWAHVMLDKLYGNTDPNITEEEFTIAEEMALADYDRAIANARNPRERASFEYDRAFLAGEWTGLRGRALQVIRGGGCTINNWMSPFTSLFGLAEEYIEFAETVRRCDPLVSIEWFNEFRAHFWAGDLERALAVAEEGSEIAPGTWLTHGRMLALVALGRYEDANRVIMNHMQWPGDLVVGDMVIEAARGDREALDAAWLELQEVPDAYQRLWYLSYLAWSGQRDAANAYAAEIDEMSSGPAGFTIFVMWCACGAPFDLEATPKFAKVIEEADLPWPPPSPIEFPLKDW